jgi:multidrug efflux pump subunit AcrA (membrane-fusion protein)
MSPRVFSTSRPKLVLNGTLAAVVLVGGGVAYALVGPASSSSAGTISRQTTVERGTVTASITASGNLAPESTSSLAFGAAGAVTAVDVTVGQQVTAGETLATISNTQANYNLQLANDALTIANDNLSKAEDGPDSVTVAADNAQLASDENAVDSAKKALSSATGSQVASDTSAVTNAEDQLNSAIAQQNESNYVAPATLTQDQEAVTQAQANVNTAQTALSGTTITAPSAGTILTVAGQVGSNVTAGTSVTGAATTSGSSSGSTGTTGTTGTGSTSGSGSTSTSTSSGTFITMADLSQLQITADVSETDVASVKTGQTATLTLNALPDQAFQGSVAEISPTSTVVSNVVEYAVTIDVTSTMPSTVRTGQSASIVITTGSVTNALYVPSTAVTTVGGRSIVTVIANGKDTVTPVTTGLVGTTDTQILTGLTQGQTVQISLSTSTTSGTTGRGFGGIGAGGGGGGFGGGGFAGTSVIAGPRG